MSENIFADKLRESTDKELQARKASAAKHAKSVVEMAQSAERGVVNDALMSNGEGVMPDEVFGESSLRLCNDFLALMSQTGFRDAEKLQNTELAGVRVTSDGFGEITSKNSDYTPSINIKSEHLGYNIGYFDQDDVETANRTGNEVYLCDDGLLRVKSKKYEKIELLQTGFIDDFYIEQLGVLPISKQGTPVTVKGCRPDNYQGNDNLEDVLADLTEQVGSSMAYSIDLEQA